MERRQASKPSSPSWVLSSTLTASASAGSTAGAAWAFCFFTAAHIAGVHRAVIPVVRVEVEPLHANRVVDVADLGCMGIKAQPCERLLA
jgi:hypothetical protein